MNIKQWINANTCKTARKELPAAAGTTFSYLEQLAYTNKKAGPQLLGRLFHSSVKLTPNTVIVPREERPDIAEIMDLTPPSNEEQERVA